MQHEYIFAQRIAYVYKKMADLISSKSYIQLTESTKFPVPTGSVITVY